MARGLAGRRRILSSVMSLPIVNLFLAAAKLPVFPGVPHSPAAGGAPVPVASGVTANALANTPRALYVSPLALTHPWITHTLAAFFVIAAVSLVILLAVQTTKQEGLSGTIGGRVESAYRTRMGGDQQLARLTSYVAIGFAFCALLLSLTGI
jgi:protein translocase SecG subunit